MQKGLRGLGSMGSWLVGFRALGFGKSSHPSLLVL